MTTQQPLSLTRQEKEVLNEALNEYIHLNLNNAGNKDLLEIDREEIRVHCDIVKGIQEKLCQAS